MVLDVGFEQTERELSVDLQDLSNEPLYVDFRDICSGKTDTHDLPIPIAQVTACVNAGWKAA